jgi:DNA-binding IclR family transcriptional regulator
MQRKSFDHEYTVKSVDKAFELLETLAEFPSGTGMQTLAELLSLSRNTTFRLMKTLCDKGLAQHDITSGTYQLGISSISLAQKILKNMSVVNYAHPILEELVRKHDEAVYMTVIQDADVLFLDMVDCDQAIKAAPLVGRRFPFFSNAAGKVMKSLDSQDLLERLLKKVTRKGDRPDLEKLNLEMSEIRAAGVAVDRGGLGEGIISVAVAVKDYSGKVVGAITLIGPSFRMLAERIETEIIPSLLAGGELLSEKFGYAPA